MQCKILWSQVNGIHGGVCHPGEIVSIEINVFAAKTRAIKNFFMKENNAVSAKVFNKNMKILALKIPSNS